MSNLRDSFGLNYEEAHQFQLMFNVELYKRREKSKSSVLPLQEEKWLFFKTSDKISAGVRVFQAPEYKRVHLIWIDPLLKRKTLLKRFKKLMDSKQMKKGHPVFVSFCYSRGQLKKFRDRYRPRQKEIRLISYELLSSYSKKFEFLNYDSLDFGPLFREDQQLHLFLMGKRKPIEFKGKFRIHRFP